MKKIFNSSKTDVYYQQLMKEAQKFPDFYSEFIVNAPEEPLIKSQLSESTTRIAKLLQKGSLEEVNQTFTVKYNSFAEASELRKEFSERNIPTAIVDLASPRTLSSCYALRFTKENWRRVLELAAEESPKAVQFECAAEDSTKAVQFQC